MCRSPASAIACRASRWTAGPRAIFSLTTGRPRPQRQQSETKRGTKQSEENHISRPTPGAPARDPRGVMTVVEYDAVHAPDLEFFLAEGRRKLAEKFLDTKLVAFRFEGEIDPDPTQAPLTAHHSLRDVVTAMEDEVYSFRPELIFPFLRECLARFPARLPREDAHTGPLLDDDYGRRIQRSIALLVEHVVSDKPDEPFEWLDSWLERAGEQEAYELSLPPPTVEEVLGGRSIWDMDVGELSEFALEVFMTYDEDGNGRLDRHEFKRVLGSTALELTKGEIREIMAETDADEDGYVDYAEFLPLMIELIGALKSGPRARRNREKAEGAVKEDVSLLFVKGLGKEELDEMLRDIFAECDTDGSGALDPTEFERALRDANVGLNNKEINLLLSEADANQDGLIEYSEFAPVCFDVLVERAKNKQLENEALQSVDGITKMLVETFRAADPEGSGRLHFSDVKACLAYVTESQEVNLSRSQLVCVAAEAEISPYDGTVRYLLFATVAAEIMHSMIDFDAQRRRAEATTALAHGADDLTGVGRFRALDKEQIEAVMLEAFADADVDGSGALDRMEMYAILQSVGDKKFGLGDKHVAGIMAAADEDGDGFVDYNELTKLIYDTLKEMEREEIVRDKAFRYEATRMKDKEDFQEVRDDTTHIQLASQSTDDYSHLYRRDESGILRRK